MKMKLELKMKLSWNREKTGLTTNTERERNFDTTGFVGIDDDEP
jgi:hypothetical protein